MLGLLRRRRRDRSSPYHAFKVFEGHEPQLADVRKMHFNPGHVVPMSGQYTDNHGEQITCVKGNTFPAGPRGKETFYRLTDHTR